MGKIIAWALGGLATFLGPLLAKALFSLGVGAVTYVGIDTLQQKMSLFIFQQLNSTGQTLYLGLDYFGIIAAIQMFLATGSAILTLKATKTAFTISKS
ncbi:DUF2523 domain-containing protein [Leeia sp. TBRC 13508]|uniref:DUF2523 domain-containing protein n=1 Tax=Leeia speluncae TaxID=2884804 RepID=A0ABS8DB08_9NEIS|nr:DUF2523 family protein [Leeia speluncae]MCB6185407.1 DUF2523 domain-containing protein [Leeia speluncae]